MSEHDEQRGLQGAGNPAGSTVPDGPKQPLGEIEQEKSPGDEGREDPEHSGARPDLKRDDDDDTAGGVGLGY